MAVYTPGMLAVEYVGGFPYVVREVKYARFEPSVTLEEGDIIFLPMLSAMMLLRRKHRLFRPATGKPFFNSDAAEITKENIMDVTTVSDEMIRAACRSYGIKTGKKTRNDLVALLLPFLEK